ncbi:GATA zinc finger domain-containing protein 1 [Eumeta japonica]|uniref:GATA zinc finger domain-containing protein 1 n=1 Tax=Eumeta variegata TaxID=151549 RepID=A0A4C1X254_EUMVA|nr:GATA zinc finger domain-containing protein 1 [Eumeta japonica]
MPKPTCVQCNTTDTFLWRNAENGQICNDCYLSNNAQKEVKTLTTSIKPENEEKKDDKEEEVKTDVESTPAKATGKGTRKSTRSTRYKLKTPAPPVKPTPPRGRGRRSIFKRQPLKAPTATATVVTSDSIFYKGMYMQVGDIVSMIDVEGGTFYAQIRGFLTDQYCEKSAVITWLLPTKASPPPEECFDPATYIIGRFAGPEEDLPRKLDVMEFVMHAPSDYYKASNSPYQLTDTELSSYNGKWFDKFLKKYYIPSPNAEQNSSRARARRAVPPGKTIALESGRAFSEHAFDSVWYGGLVHKLHVIEVSDLLIHIIHGYISKKHWAPKHYEVTENSLPYNMSRKEALSSFIQQIHGRPVVVKLNSGVDYRGVLACLDGYMNIALEQTEEYVNGQLKNKYGDAFIRGNNVLYISTQKRRL